MSQPVNRPPPAGLAEAQAYTIIKFHVMQPNGNFQIQEADCLVGSVICGLKEDLARQLGPPETQKWFYRGKLMLDTHRLKDYGIDGEDDVQIEVNPSTM